MTDQQKVTIDLPDWVADLTAAERRAIGADICEFIRDRCAVGRGVQRVGDSYWRAVTFPAYTPEYREKKGSSRVDLRLSSEMLDKLKTLQVNETSVEVGFSGGAKLQGKVEGNRIGSYGGEPNPAKARDFLGVTRAELAAILAAYKPERKGR